MHFIDKAQYIDLRNAACACSRDKAGTEIRGLLVHTGHCLSFARTRNSSRRAGGFVLSRMDVRRIVAAAKALDHEVVGTFHSHPLGLAKPGQSDIDHAVDDSLMFIFDCLGKVGRLWRIKRGKAQSLNFRFLRGDSDT